MRWKAHSHRAQSCVNVCKRLTPVHVTVPTGWVTGEVRDYWSLESLPSTCKMKRALLGKGQK